MRGMVAVALGSALLLAASATASTARPALTPSVLAKEFATATGTRLHVDSRASVRGHYTALVGSQSIAEIGAYGRFVIYVFSTSSLKDVNELLANTHTGVLGAPGSASVYWEHGTTMGGDRFWLAKKRYGPNIVLWWYGPQAKVTPPFGRLHRALQRIAG
jgi:hypothetical protein